MQLSLRMPHILYVLLITFTPVPYDENHASLYVLLQIFSMRMYTDHASYLEAIVDWKSGRGLAYKSEYELVCFWLFCSVL